MSRRQMLDDPSTAYPQLAQFLGGYFHQDWPADGASWEDIAGDFIAESTRSSVTDTAAELRALLAQGFSDTELGGVLDGLGCSVDPGAFGLDAQAWLEALLVRVARA